MPLSRCGCHDASGDGNTPLSTFDSLGCCRERYVVWVILRLRFHRQKPTEVPAEFVAIPAGFAEQLSDTIMILTGRSLAETNTTHGVGGIDCSVNGQARGGDAAFLREFVLSRGQVLVCLGQIAACLGGTHVPGSHLPRQRGSLRIR